MTKLASALPKEGANGLDAISRALINDDQAEHLVIGIVKCKDWTHDPDSGYDTPTAKFVAIEVINGADARTARHMLGEAYAKRTGQDSLTLDQMLAGDHADGTGKPCPKWHKAEGSDELWPCIYEAGHDLPHKLRDGTEFGGPDDTPAVEAAGPAFQEPADD